MVDMMRDLDWNRMRLGEFKRQVRQETSSASFRERLAPESAGTGRERKHGAFISDDATAIAD